MSCNNTFSIIDRNDTSFTILFKKDFNSYFFHNESLIVTLPLLSNNNTIDNNNNLSVLLEYEDCIISKCYSSVITDKFGYGVKDKFIIHTSNKFIFNDFLQMFDTNSKIDIKIKVTITNVDIKLHKYREISFIIVDLDKYVYCDTNKFYRNLSSKLNFDYLLTLQPCFKDNKILVTSSLTKDIYYDNNDCIVEFSITPTKSIKDNHDIVIKVFNNNFINSVTPLISINYQHTNIQFKSLSIMGTTCQVHIVNGLCKTNDYLQYELVIENANINIDKPIIIYHPQIIHTRNTVNICHIC